MYKTVNTLGVVQSSRLWNRGIFRREVPRGTECSNGETGSAALFGASATDRGRNTLQGS